MARGRSNGSLIVESTRSGQLLQTFKAQSPFAIGQVQFSRDGAVLSSVDPSEIYQRNAATGQLTNKIGHAASSEATLPGDETLVASYANRELFLERLPEN